MRKPKIFHVMPFHQFNKTGAQEGDTPRVSPSRAPVLSFARYSQAPATQARKSSKFQLLNLFTMGVLEGS